MKKLITWLKESPVLREEKTLLIVWTLTGIIYSAVKLLMGKYNNYKIFEHVFEHAANGLPLYAEYPAEYYDVNHYGILFSLIILPFSLFPTWLGMTLWIVANTWFLFYAVRQLPLSYNQRIFVYWFALCELMTAQEVQQFNISVVAFILLAFSFIERKKDFWAACVILLGTFIKIYPIVGLAFFFFSKQKVTFTLSCFFWGIVFLALPTLYTPGPEYVFSQYLEWFDRLAFKNELNMFALSQNVSLLGMVRKISGCAAYSDLCLIVPALILFFIPYFRISQYKYFAFRVMLLANVLLFVVLFSSGTEASGYIVCMIGVALWYLFSPSENQRYRDRLMWATLIIVGISTTEIVPPFLRHNFIVPFVLKAWMCSVVWFTIVYEMIFLDFSSGKNNYYLCSDRLKTQINR